MFQMYKYIDMQIEGKWREIIPFKYLEHPPLDIYMSMEDIIASNGFDRTEYWVETEDG